MRALINVLALASVLALAGCGNNVIAPPTAIDFGDSTSKAYAAYARTDLVGVVDFRHDPWDTGDIVPEDTNAYIAAEINASNNNGYSTTLLEGMETRLASDSDHFNVLAFNSGYHDLQHNPADVGAVNVPADVYRSNLEAIAQLAEAHADVVIWIDTPGILGDTATVGTQVVDAQQIQVYNAIAEDVAREHGFYVLNMPSTGHQPDNVHFTGDGYRALAKRVSDCVLLALSQAQSDSCHR